MANTVSALRFGAAHRSEENSTDEKKTNLKTNSVIYEKMNTQILLDCERSKTKLTIV